MVSVILDDDNDCCTWCSSDPRQPKRHAGVSGQARIHNVRQSEEPSATARRARLQLRFHAIWPVVAAARRAFWQQFHPAVVSRYWPSQQSSTRELLVKLLDKPAACDDLLRYHFSASALKAVYNVDITSVDDKRVAVIEDLFVGLREITVSAQFFLDYFPVLQYVPTCTPGIGKWLKKLAASKAPNDYLIDKEFADAKARVERNGVADVSAVSHLLAKISETSAEEEAIDGEDEQIAKGVAAVAVEGGTDTTFSTAEGFFLAMALHPEVQRKAQAELDAVVGPHRLPDFSDRESLVYINALVKESLRWHNVLPLGVPHRTIQDDEFHGYFIPKGTLVTPNVWACMHDPQIYPEPKKFNPDRFVREGKLTPDVLDPTNFVFGFGRRICPGRHFADAGLFILIASVLHVYNIEPPLGEDGRPIKIDHEQCHGFLSYPENFACVVKPRSEKAVALIRRSRPAKGLESD
ncbi:hypothetical protein NUW54_g10252 [Trametes sanguinea]|uniref:Uncharacterized protein n=1 Tax=Trametes sanguinea TaxID=158606 RepID=A0ACC1P3E4_9APHY|nr:hypothetical protein NUW54_g10252 [Trametes sanguinea]